VHALIKERFIAPPTFQHLSVCKVDTDIVATFISFEGTISAKSKYKPVNQGFEKYWKSRESGQQNKLRSLSLHLTAQIQAAPDKVLESELAVALSLSIIR
jgi:hypothetical protein